MRNIGRSCQFRGHAVEDNTLAKAQVTLIRSQLSRYSIGEHVEQSRAALAKSYRLLRATVPVLPYRDERPALQSVEG
jgi:hypothetical protein